jgi:hypothetical protein
MGLPPPLSQTRSSSLPSMKGPTTLLAGRARLPSPEEREMFT